MPVLYYVSPQVWAWRRGRVKKIARLSIVWRSFSLLSRNFIAGKPIEVEYVGNPLLDEAKVGRSKEEFLTHTVSIRPGRWSAFFPAAAATKCNIISRHLLDGRGLIYSSDRIWSFLLPVAPLHSRRDTFEQLLAARPLPVTMVSDDIYDAANACDAILAVSGTVTLQIALVGTPMAIVYRVAPTDLCDRRTPRSSIRLCGLANIVAGEEIVVSSSRSGHAAAIWPQKSCAYWKTLISRRMRNGLRW